MPKNVRRENPLGKEAFFVTKNNQKPKQEFFRAIFLKKAHSAGKKGPFGHKRGLLLA